MDLKVKMSGFVGKTRPSGRVGILTQRVQIHHRQGIRSYSAQEIPLGSEYPNDSYLP